MHQPSSAHESHYQQQQQLLQQQSSSNNALHVHVEGVSFQYTLTENDLMNVFSRYGPVRLVHVNLDGSSAIVYYFVSSDAAKAVHDLDGKLLSGVQGCLRVRPVVELASAVGNSSSKSPSLSPGLDCSIVNGAVRKYTCRFEIGIENEKEFHVARRLIGPKGCQMKRILMACEGPETPKLRLRGIGSGFLEGALKQESPEPLHLCISCKDYANYRKAVDMVIDLLMTIYKDYGEFCKQRGISNKPVPYLNYRETPLVSQIASFTPTPSTPAFTPQPSPTHVVQPQVAEERGAAARAGWAHMAGGLTFPQPEEGLSLSASCRTDLSETEKAEILALVEERNAHRARGNYQEADRIREILRAKGVGLMDEPGGRGRGSEVTTWRMWKRT
jgi:hypothetical protein